MNRKRGLLKRIAILASIVTVMFVILTGCVGDTIRLGTGGTGGTYYSYGEKLSNLDSYIEIKTTAGSEANIRLIDKGFVDAAIVQSDILELDKGNCAALTGLYTEAVQLIAKKDSGITDVNSLKGKRVSVGETESGVLRNAQQILLASGMTFNDIEVKNLSFNDSVEALEKGEIDAFFCTAGVPTNAVYKLTETGDASLVEFNPDMIGRLLNLYPGYNECVIPAGTYKGQDKEIHTVGVRAVLVVNPNMNNRTATRLMELVFDNSEELNRDIATDGKITPQSAVASVGIPFHPAAAEYLEKQGVTVAKWSKAKKKSVFGSQDE